MATSPNASCFPRCINWRGPAAAGLLRRHRDFAHAARREAFRAKMREEVRQFLEGAKFRRRPVDPFRRKPALRRRRHERSALYQAIGAKLAAVGMKNVLYYLSTQPSYYSTVAAGLGAAACGIGTWSRGGHRRKRRRVAPDRGRETVRPRPRERTRAQRPAARRFPGAGDLPHRSLPGQGNRAEHPGLPLRQRHLRAFVEPPLRQPRADHCRRSHRRGGPRRLLPGSRRAARHDPESPPPGAGDRRHGARRRVRTQRRAR